MNKTIKKLVAFVAAFAMIMAMSAVTFAANYNTNDAVTTTDTTLNIPKTLKVTNENLSSVAGPGLTYSYTIQSETPSSSNGGTTITDEDTPTNHTGTVHAGPAGGVSLSTSSVSFPVTEALVASSSGANNTKNIVASVHLDEFGTQAGIYRYRITEESNPANPASVGVDDTNAAEVRYLDVYLERDDSNNAPYPVKVSGYVVHTGARSDGEGAPNTKSTFDDSAFVTHNIKLTNKVEGNMGDRGNQFPFAGTIVDNGRYFYAKKSAAPTALAASEHNQDSSNETDMINGVAAGSSLPQDLTLAHGEEYYISGLSKVATVTYTETNNTPDVYQVKIDNGESAISTSSAVNADGTKAFDNAIAVGENNNAVNNVIFTNTLENVSPTGVIFKYGAALLVLAAAGALFALNRKSKKASATC